MTHAGIHRLSVTSAYPTSSTRRHCCSAVLTSDTTFLELSPHSALKDRLPLVSGLLSTALQGSFVPIRLAGTLVAALLLVLHLTLFGAILRNLASSTF